MASTDEARALALGLAAAAGAQLAGWRVFDSLVPDPVSAMRRDIGVTSAGVQLAGAAALCIPPMRPLARWLNVGVHGVALALAVDNVRNPKRFRRSRTTHLRSMLAPARIPVHIAAIGLTVWVTRSAPARRNIDRGGVRAPMDRAQSRSPDPAVDDESPESASPSQR